MGGLKEEREREREREREGGGGESRHADRSERRGSIPVTTNKSA